MQSIEEILQRALSDMVSDIRSNHIAAGQMATGKTIGSLETQVSSVGDGVYSARLLGSRWFGALETGTGPARKRGTDTQRKEFIASLVEWCRVRNIPTDAMKESDYVRFAYYLKWKITHFGTDLYQRGGRRDIFTPAIESFADTVTEKVGQYFETQIVNLITK